MLFGLALLSAPPAGAVSHSLWNDSFMPANPSVTDGLPLTLGVKFRSEVDGHVTGIRFYKGADNTGNNLASLWTSDGTQLASTTFTNETSGGWQEQLLASPVAISANTTYVVSYFSPSGYFAITAPYFNAGNYVNSPLVALGDGVDGGNGVFAYGPSEAFPVDSFNSANYWVDVVFEAQVDPCANDTNAPVIIACAADRTLVADENGEGVVPDLTGEVVAEDDCPGMMVVTQSPAAGTVLGVGLHLVTLTVADASGNTTTCTATLTIEDQNHSPGVIGDFVWNDRNRNGIQDSGEPGLPRIRVRLFDCLTHRLIATEFTDSAGYYRFEGQWTNDLYLKFDLLPNFVFSPQGQGSDGTRDSDVGPYSGRTECFVVNCQTPGAPDCVQTNWDAGMFWTPCTLRGVASPGYWKNHPDDWPRTVKVGGVIYTADRARELMSQPVKGDKSLTLFRSLVAAKLNVLCGNDSTCIMDTMNQADRWAGNYPPESGVEGRSAAWKIAAPLHERLDDYNNGRLCAPKYDGRLSVGCGGGNDRPCHFRLRIDGEPGTVYLVQESTDCLHWTTIDTVTNAFGITEYLAQMTSGKPRSFYRAIPAPGNPSVEPYQNVFGTFMELTNDRRVDLFPVVYSGNLIVRGNANVISGAPNGQTVIAGDLVIQGNANHVGNLKVLGNVILRGNANTLQEVDVSGEVEDTGNANEVF